jgi:beta-glucanase (GH16 family)
LGKKLIKTYRTCRSQAAGPGRCTRVRTFTCTEHRITKDPVNGWVACRRASKLVTAAPPGKTLVFEDDFDGTALDTTSWSPYTTPGHHGNGLRRPSAFSVENGNLVVTATWDGTNIVSGGMRNSKDYMYGSFEFRVRTEPDPTAQLSGVVLTWPQTPGPEHTENDMYETGHKASRDPFHSYIHYGTTNRQYRYTYEADASQWHTMRMDWRADKITLYRDGVLTHTLTDRTAIPDVMHHLDIQLDAFGNRALRGPVKMYVDWVRIYQ